MSLKTYLLIFPLLFWNNYQMSNAEPISGANIRTPNEHDYPFLVSLGYVNYVQGVQENHFCTGALISERHVVTSAHCVADVPPSNIQVHVGSVDLRVGRKYSVGSWKMFSQWARENRQPFNYNTNDVVVIKLTDFVDDAEPALISSQQNLVGTNAIIAGWGRTNTGRNSRYLQAVDVTAIDMFDCSDRITAALGRQRSLSSVFVCTVANPPAFLDCGDSGGPLFTRDGGFYVIIGLNSATCPKDIPNGPNTVNVHTRIAPYSQFLRAMIRQ